MAKKRSLTSQLVAVVAFVVVLIVMLNVCSADKDETPSASTSPARPAISTTPQAWYEKENKGGALVAAQNIVKGYLNYPSSAKFESAFWVGGNNGVNVIGSLRNQEYSVYSWVDAQNAFGTTIRTRFIVYVKQVAEDRWQVMTDSDGNPRVGLDSEGD